MQTIGNKRQKTQSADVTHHRFPGEIRNMLYKCAALPDNVKQVERLYKSVGPDGTITVSDSVHTFYLDTVNESGTSQLFSKEITKVAEIADEVLSYVTPWILFTFTSPDALRLFAEAFAAHSAVCTREIELHVEFDFGASMNETDRRTFSKWLEMEEPHGRQQGAHDVFEEWMNSVKDLPTASTHVHLVFPYFWRDFRSLRGLSEKTGLREYQITFRFPKEEPYHTYSVDDHDFFIAQTIAAVKGIEVVEQAGINEKTRADLVAFGCRGFNRTRGSPGHGDED
ncbi:hypothetical protein N0V83_003681 [Neocucurbitaria cava]|uniref:Uncharacterized protein n=1 Tax=Neocucurbitaria cava TaxID=798079 RepID=A0A9W8YDP4_9PLEO|nr:hypothetical protein N0V83_003681 [Neocucurbitaria cava]